MTSELHRRALFQSAGIGALALFATAAPAEAAQAATAGSASTSATAATSFRAKYHMTPPSGWLSDPQRPVFTRGAYQLYYLHSDVDNGYGGWDHVSTTDGINFTFQGTVIPLQTNLPTWTGCTLIDTNNTAGYGAGAVIALATRPTGGVRKYQEQYLFYSTDGGFTFTARPNPDAPRMPPSQGAMRRLATVGLGGVRQSLVAVGLSGRVRVVSRGTQSRPLQK